MVWSIRLALRKAEEPMSAEMIIARESASAARNCPFIVFPFRAAVVFIAGSSGPGNLIHLLAGFFSEPCTLSRLIYERGRKLVKHVLWAFVLGAVSF